MKKILSIALMISLLIPSTMALAETSETPTDPLAERNQALTAFLSENLTDEAAYDADARTKLIEEFFNEQPQYANLEIKEASSTNSLQGRSALPSPQELNTVTVYSNETQISATEKTSSELYITYYDDGSFVLGTLTASNNEDQSSPEVVAAKQDLNVNNATTTRIASRAAGTSGIATANNTHERWDGNIFVWRTFLHSEFYYDNTNNRRMCNPTKYSGNQRVRDGNIVFTPAYYNATYPYNNSVCRQQRTQTFHQHPGNIFKGSDDLRISCNHLGQIFKN